MKTVSISITSILVAIAVILYFNSLLQKQPSSHNVDILENVCPNIDKLSTLQQAELKEYEETFNALVQ